MGYKDYWISEGLNKGIWIGIIISLIVLGILLTIICLHGLAVAMIVNSFTELNIKAIIGITIVFSLLIFFVGAYKRDWQWKSGLKLYSDSVKLDYGHNKYSFQAAYLYQSLGLQLFIPW